MPPIGPRPVRRAVHAVVAVLAVVAVAGCVGGGVSDVVPQQRGALAWVDGDRLVVSFFVPCVAPASSRRFRAVTVLEAGVPVWGVVADGPDVRPVASVTVGVAPVGYTATTYDRGRLAAVSGPGFAGEIVVEVVDESGASGGGSLNLAARGRLTDGVVIWGGQRTRRSAVTCPT